MMLTKEPILARRRALVVPVLVVTSDAVRVVGLDGEERVHGL